MLNLIRAGRFLPVRATHDNILATNNAEVRSLVEGFLFVVVLAFPKINITYTALLKTDRFVLLSLNSLNHHACNAPLSKSDPPKPSKILKMTPSKMAGPRPTFTGKKRPAPDPPLKKAPLPSSVLQISEPPREDLIYSK